MAGEDTSQRLKVSTHSRPKAAELTIDLQQQAYSVSTHSRPKAADCRCCIDCQQEIVSTHSRPKAAEKRMEQRNQFYKRFNTQPPEGG